MTNLGVCYKNGTGVEQNSKKAVELFKKSSKLEYALGNLIIIKKKKYFYLCFNSFFIIIFFSISKFEKYLQYKHKYYSN